MKKNNLLIVFLLINFMGISQSFDPYNEEEIRELNKALKELENYKDPEINFPENKNYYNISQSDNYYKSRKEINAYAYLDSLTKSNQNKNDYGEITSFDIEETNYNRFKSSPCFNEIGFNSSWNLNDLEKEYSLCEEKKLSRSTFNLFYIIIFVIILLTVIYFSLSKKTKEQINTYLYYNKK